VLIFELRPYDSEFVWARGTLGSSQAQITYLTGRPYATLWLEIDNVRRWTDAAYEVTWQEPWAPRWQGQVANQTEGRLRFEFQFVTPEPLNAEVAARLLQGLRVTIRDVAERQESSYLPIAANRVPLELPERLHNWWADRWLLVPKIRDGQF
jgi:hypothetical protein